MADGEGGGGGSPGGTGGAAGVGPLCGACGERPSKYRCPACGVRTCSAACVRAHKEASGCTGERPPAHSRRVSRAEYGLSDLRADYRFLEGARRAGEAAGPAARAPPPPRREGLPAHLERLQARCKRSGVDLRLMQPAMQRRRENTSRLQGRSDRLAWRVEWRFITPPAVPSAPGGGSASGDGGPSSFSVRPTLGDREVRVDVRVLEDAPLGGVLDCHLRPRAPPWAHAEAKAGEETGDRAAGRPQQTPPTHRTRRRPLPPAASLGGDEEARSQLQALRLGAFAKENLEDLGVFLREEGRPANSPRYFRIDLSRSLRENLAGKTVVEFPVLSVTLPDGRGGWLGRRRFPLADKCARGSEASEAGRAAQIGGSSVDDSVQNDVNDS